MLRSATRLSRVSELPGSQTPKALYRRFDQAAVRERLCPTDAAVCVTRLLLQGYGLTVSDVKRATGVTSDDAALGYLAAATRQLHVLTTKLPPSEDRQPRPGRPTLVWYLDPSTAPTACICDRGNLCAD